MGQHLKSNPPSQPSVASVVEEKPKEVVETEAPKPEQTQAPEPTIADLMKVVMALAGQVEALKKAPPVAVVAPRRAAAVRLEGQEESPNAIHPGDVKGEVPIRTSQTGNGSTRLDY